MGWGRDGRADVHVQHVLTAWQPYLRLLHPGYLFSRLTMWWLVLAAGSQTGWGWV